MKYILLNKKEGVFNSDNPISPKDLEKVNDLEIPESEGLSPVSLGDGTVEWKPRAPQKLKEVLVQRKEQLLEPLQSDILYVIDGDIVLTGGESIIVPESGLNIMGYSFDASRIGAYGVSNHSIFTSPSGGSGNLVIHNIAFTTTGTNSRVFDIKDRTGFHALEMVTVNFEGCTSIGTIDGYRQGTGITIGFYGCKQGLEFKGAWNGFKLTNTNAFGFGENAVMFRAGENLTFKNRFYLEVNIDLPVTSALCDFSDANFLDDKLLQVNTTLAKSGGTINVENTSTLFPNITPFSPKALFVDNIGLKNSFEEPWGLRDSYLEKASSDTNSLLQNGEIYIESTTGYPKVKGQGDGVRSLVPEHVRNITLDEKNDWNKKIANKVKTFFVFDGDLTTVDQAGLIQYLNTEGFSIKDGEHLLVKIVDFKFRISIISPKEGASTNVGESLLIRTMFLQQINITEPAEGYTHTAGEDVLIKVNIT